MKRKNLQDMKKKNNGQIWVFLYATKEDVK